MDSEDGSALVIYAFVFLVCLMLAGLVIDGGRALLTQIQMQTAADAAALAGTHLLANRAESAELDVEIARMALLNRADGSQWEYSEDQVGVAVTAYRTIETYFASILGYESIYVSAMGAAGAFPIAGLGNLMPFTVSCADAESMIPGQIYRFWDNDRIAPGNVAWLDWNGGSSSTPELARNIREPNQSGYYDLGEWIDTSPGVRSSSLIRSALNERLNKRSYLPLYGSVQGNGNNTQVQLCGFAQFVITAHNMTGRDKYIEGHFFHSTVNGPPANQDSADFGLRMIQLTQ